MTKEIKDLQKQLDLLQQRLQRKEIEMNSIKQIGKTLSSELRTERLLVLIMDEVTRLMNAERSTFYIVDEERGELWSKIAQKAEIKEIRLKIGTGIAGHVAKTGEIINIKDAYQDSRFDPTTDKKTGYHTKSILCMPIFEPKSEKNTPPGIIGVLQVLNKIDGIFTSDDEDLLASIASQVAISVINARLYTALEKKIDEINLLFEIERELNKAYNLDELLQLFLDKICRTLKVEAATLALIDEKSGALRYRAAKNLDINRLNSMFQSAGNTLTARVLKEGELLVVNQLDQESASVGNHIQGVGLDIKQMVSAPLLFGNQVKGVMEIFNKSEKNEFFREDDIHLIRSLGSQIARTIEAYRLREEKIQADRLASIGNMMSTIVHDIRTPMNNIYGFVDLLREEDDPELRAEYSEIIINQIKTLTNMTTDILDFAKGKTSILPVKYPVDKIIDNFRKFFEMDVRKRGFEFEVACHTQSMIYVDPEKINRVFMNIMKNALEAMEKGGKFSLIADESNGEIVFHLSDTGKGIPAEIKDRLFESFVTSGKEGGTGLGLAIVKNIIDQHKGRIEVESSPGQGTTFKIILKRL